MLNRNNKKMKRIIYRFEIKLLEYVALPLYYGDKEWIHKYFVACVIYHVLPSGIMRALNLLSVNVLLVEYLWLYGETTSFPMELK